MLMKHAVTSGACTGMKGPAAAKVVSRCPWNMQAIDGLFVELKALDACQLALRRAPKKAPRRSWAEPAAGWQQDGAAARPHSQAKQRQQGCKINRRFTSTLVAAPSMLAGRCSRLHLLVCC